MSKEKLLCRLGFHRPLRGHNFHFRDVVSGKEVFLTRCPCGLPWMTDSIFPWLGAKVLAMRGREKP